MTAPSIDPVCLKDAIVTKLQGGLGNILFQYMAGLSLARKYDCELYCAQDGGIMHQSGLELVGIEPKYVQLPEDLMRRSRRKKDRRVSEHLKSAFGLWPLKPITEPHFHYWPGFETLKPGILLSGYWQSPDYFSSLQESLDEVIKLEPVLETCDADLLKRMKNCNSVSVHIRRGDFLKDPSALAVHGIIEMDYYDNCRKHLEKKIKPERYFVFSDAPETAQDLLSHWDRVEFVSGNNQQEDLALMSQCHHNIIANSSFSWWAAMLNSNSGKQVYAPKNWFTDEALKRRDIKDLHPKDWTIL
ncbi:alpha-1,2-fucosyltransferase [uncultured Cohaesibacter sp.]|uniref:alpha-1,2-fucosyltransferase n=1 Tax=uncultured Cohaesibacter sp. TaxID=1002546 RepID=UPI0029C8F4BC|nr:alpha-1,2-fucosyltransferase [uncultured Cohaesibacter sp.]